MSLEKRVRFVRILWIPIVVVAAVGLVQSIVHSGFSIGALAAALTLVLAAWWYSVWGFRGDVPDR